MNNIKISLSYTTNFKPSDFLNFNSLILFKPSVVKKNNKIISRNFFLFFLLLKYINIKNLSNINTSVFVKPFFKKLFVVLRAPYRYKLSRHQFVLSRYFIVCTINLKSKTAVLNNYNNFVEFINFSKKFSVWFESNLVYQHRFKFVFKCTSKNNFLLDNFINRN